MQHPALGEVNSDKGVANQAQMDTEDDPESNGAEPHEPRITTMPPTMGKLTTHHETWGGLMRRANNTNEILTVVSDGSVRDFTRRGTWAWSIVTKGAPHGLKLGKLSAVGKETIQHQDLLTRETFSYRMEAMALLGGLTYLHEHIKWKGKVQWHTDSKSVIQTYNNRSIQSHPGTWEKQRDKDVWDVMVQIRQQWDGRLTLNHVESHVDRKKDEQGNSRTPTPIQWMNIAVDALADTGYTDKNAPETYIDPQRRNDRYIMVKNGLHNGEITGKTRTQIKEECIMDDTIEKAGESNSSWGESPEHVDWRRMRKTLPTAQMSDTLFASKWMHAKLATNHYVQMYAYYVNRNGRRTRIYSLNARRTLHTTAGKNWSQRCACLWAHTP